MNKKKELMQRPNSLKFLPHEEKFIESIWKEFESCGLDSKELLHIVTDKLFAMMVNPDFSNLFLSMQIQQDARNSLSRFIGATNLCGDKAIDKLTSDIEAGRFETDDLLKISKSLGQTAKFLQDVVTKADEDAANLAMQHNANKMRLSDEFQALPERGKAWVYYGISVVVSIAKKLNFSAENEEEISPKLKQLDIE